jgi:hypothetical protein
MTKQRTFLNSAQKMSWNNISHQYILSSFDQSPTYINRI